MNDDFFITGSKITLSGVPDTVAGGKCANLAIRLRGALKRRGTWLTGSRKPRPKSGAARPTLESLAHEAATLSREESATIAKALSSGTAKVTLPKSKVRHT